MDFRLSEEAEALRAEVTAFLDETLTTEMLDGCARTGVNHDPAFSAALRDKGWLALQWPVEHGGQGRSPLEALPYVEETQRRNAPVYGISTTMMIAHVINAVGTEAQKAEILPRAFSTEIVIALGFTEPENGSDAAAASTRAVRDGSGWRITGSKMFTTNAHIADYVFMLARTNPDAPKHAGLTTFLVPMDQVGVEVRAVHTMSGERTNVTFYSEVHVSDEWRVGEVDGGWQVMGVAFATEHAGSWAGEQSRLLDALTGWLRSEEGAEVASTPQSTEQVGRSLAELEVSRLLHRRAAWLKTTGGQLVGKGSMSKLFSTTRLQRQAEAALQLVGPDALRSEAAPGAVSAGAVEHMVRHCVGTRIYGGTDEIQRNQIAQHVLGLPRS